MSSLYDKEGYQEIILINGLDKETEKEFERFNNHARIAKKYDGYFYNTKDKNIYSNTRVWGPGGAGHWHEIILNYNSDENKLRFETAAKRNDWIPIYEHTKFLINRNKERVWFSFQFLPKDMQYLKTPFAIISAENPSMGKQDETLNEISNKRMKSILKDLEYEFYDSIGELSGYIENCFIIYNIDENEAIKLGQEFQQESIVFNDGESLQILECSSKNSLLSFEFKSMYL